MRGLKPEMIPELVRRDVELVKKEAIFLLEFRGGDTEVKISPENRLNILVVIGPVENHAINDKRIIKYFPKEAILLEIGLRRGRPYAEAKNTSRRVGEPVNFPFRRKWFQMSGFQFLKTVPLIFRLFQEHANKITFHWRDSYISGLRNWWSHRQGKLFCEKKYRLRKKGIRFSVHKKDEHLLKFVYWAELNLNHSLKNHLSGLVKFIDKRLKIYRENGYSRKFSDLKGARQIEDIIRRQHLPLYFLEEMIKKYIPRGAKNPFINEISELVGYNGDKILERQLAQSAYIPDINDIELRVVCGLEEAKDYIVFELESNFAFNDLSPNGDCPL